jgi:hypothetical protein
MMAIFYSDSSASLQCSLIFLFIERNFTSEIYYCYYVISGYHGNELSNVNTLYSRKLLAVFFQCIVSILWILEIFLCGYVKYSMLWKGETLRLPICQCNTREMVLTSTSTDHSITRRGWKGIQEKAYVTSDGIFRFVFSACYTPSLNVTYRFLHRYDTLLRWLLKTHPKSIFQGLS